jgi:nitrogen fixation protein FixH
MAQREFTGRHALMVFIAFFGTIFAVNLFMAYSAISTFPGLEVKNGYIASQQFNTRRAEQEALGWIVDADLENGYITLAIVDANGAPVQVSSLKAPIGRPTEAFEDVIPEYEFNGTAYVGKAELSPGNWNVRMVARALDGTLFTQRIVLHVKG